MEKQLEVGLHFYPSDEELLFLLKKRTEGEGRPSNFVIDRELYGRNAEPWEIFKDNDPNWEEDAFDRKKRVLHVFTKLSNLSGKRISRTAGCGTWEGQTKGKQIYAKKHQHLLGTKKTFTFGVKKGSKSLVVGGHWTMYEYSLANLKSDYVICKIIKSKFNNKKVLNDECENQESSRPTKKLKSQAADYGSEYLSNSVQEYACSSSNGDQEQYFQAGGSTAYFSSDADQDYYQGSSFGGDFIMSGQWNSESEKSLAIETANWDMNPMVNYSEEAVLSENVEIKSNWDGYDTSMVNQENLELPNNVNDTSSSFLEEEMWAAVKCGEEFQFVIDDKEDFIPNSLGDLDSTMEGFMRDIMD